VATNVTENIHIFEISIISSNAFLEMTKLLLMNQFLLLKINHFLFLDDSITNMMINKIHLSFFSELHCVSGNKTSFAF